MFETLNTYTIPSLNERKGHREGGDTYIERDSAIIKFAWNLLKKTQLIRVHIFDELFFLPNGSKQAEKLNCVWSDMFLYSTNSQALNY